MQKNVISIGGGDKNNNNNPGGGGAGTPIPATAVANSPKKESRRQKKLKKSSKKHRKSEEHQQQQTNSRREKGKRRTHRRRTQRHHSKNKEAPEVDAPTAMEERKLMQTQEDAPPSNKKPQQQLASGPKKKREKVEKVSLKRLVVSSSKPPTPEVQKEKEQEFDNDHVPIGAIILTEKFKYKVIKKLGSGGCGETFVVQSLKTKKELCAKVEFLNKEDLRLRKEFEIYREIDKARTAKNESLPNLLNCWDWGEVDGKMQFLFLPLMQNSLEGCMKQGYPSLSTAFEITLQVLDGLQQFHSIGFIHRDLKPANVVINAEMTKAYLIDFGMSCKYVTDPAKMPDSSAYDFIGTTKYAPREAHKGLPQCRRSDMESWIYVILELFVADLLPWRDVSKHAEVLQMKELFFSNCYDHRIAMAPKCFSEIIKLIEPISNVGAPDYAKISNLIKKEAAEMRKLKLKQKFKFDLSLMELDRELFETEKIMLDAMLVSSKRSSIDNVCEELKMDSEKSPPKLPPTPTIKSKTPSRPSSPENQQQQPKNNKNVKEADEHQQQQAPLHSIMKCRVVVPEEGGGGKNGSLPDGSDDDS